METILESNQIQAYNFDDPFGDNARVEKAILYWDVNFKKHNYGSVVGIEVQKIAIQGTADDEDGNAYAKEFECEFVPKKFEYYKRGNAFHIDLYEIEVNYFNWSIILNFR